MRPVAVRRELRARAQQVRSELHAEWGTVPHQERVLAADFDRPGTPAASIPWSAVALVVDADDRVLYLRDESHDHLRWEPPGGRGEPDERPVETAVRETREETGVAATVRGLVLTETLCWDHGDEGLYPVAQAVFLADKVGGEAEAREGGIAEVAWHPVEDLSADAQYRERVRAALSE